MSQTSIDFSQDYATWVAGDGADLNEFTIDQSGVGDPDPWTWANLVNSYIAAAYGVHRGAACSIKGRSANSSGAIADITLAEGEFLGRRSNVVDGYTLALSDLPSASARSVLCRASNSSGARADLQGSGTAAAPQVLTDNGTALSFAPFAIGGITDSTLYEVDLSGLATNTLTSGTEVIDGLNWTAANSANATTFEVLNGSGVHFDASTNNNAFSTAAQTAPYLAISWANLLGANYDPFGTYAVWFRIGSATMGVNGNQVRFFVTGASAFTDMGSIIRQRPSGTLGWSYGGAGGSTATHQNAAATDVAVLVISPNLVRGYYGTWSSGWPARSALTYIGANTPGVGANADDSGWGDPLARIGMAFATNEAGGTMDVVIPRIRVERIRG